MTDPTAALVADPGRPAVVMADHPQSVVITTSSKGVLRIALTDHEGLTHVFTHGGGPLYYIETREEEEDLEDSLNQAGVLAVEGHLEPAT